MKEDMTLYQDRHKRGSDDWKRCAANLVLWVAAGYQLLEGRYFIRDSDVLSSDVNATWWVNGEGPSTSTSAMPDFAAQPERARELLDARVSLEEQCVAEAEADVQAAQKRLTACADKLYRWQIRRDALTKYLDSQAVPNA